MADDEVAEEGTTEALEEADGIRLDLEELETARLTANRPAERRTELWPTAKRMIKADRDDDIPARDDRSTIALCTDDEVHREITAMTITTVAKRMVRERRERRTSEITSEEIAPDDDRRSGASTDDPFEVRDVPGAPMDSSRELTLKRTRRTKEVENKGTLDRVDFDDDPEVLLAPDELTAAETQDPRRTVAKKAETLGRRRCPKRL